MSLYSLLFGPNKIWKQLAEDIGGVYEFKDIFSRDKITLTYKQWIIRLDNHLDYDEDGPYYTRLRVLTSFQSPLNFEIREHPFINFTLGKKKPFKIGDLIIDKKFVFRSNDEKQLKSLFKSHKVYYNFFRVSGDGCFKFRRNVLSYEEVKIRNVNKLKSLFLMFKRTLDYLDSIDKIKINQTS